MGQKLYNYYQDITKIKDLIKLGDISSLYKHLKPNPKYEHSDDNRQEDVTLFYKRDLKGKWKYSKPIHSKNIEVFQRLCESNSAEFIYLYDIKDKKWLYSERSIFDTKKLDFYPLEEAFNIEKEVAIKSGYYFMIFNEDEVPFFNELKKTNKIVSVNDEKYYLYEAPNLELAQKVDALMGNDELGYDIDEYLIDNKIKI